MRRRFSTLLTILAASAAVAAPLTAQRVESGDIVSGVMFQGYDFADGLGVEAVNLTLVPLAYRLSIGNVVGVDLYTAWARGAVLIDGTEFTLSGPVDTQLRANWSVTPWAVVTFGLSAPTGVSSQTPDEARVSAVLATDLLGFREASFGLGLGATTGIATATRIGDTGVGFGASYRVASEFEPRADTAFKYTPGNEIRIRVGIDRNIGMNKLTAGITYQNFATDELDGRDLFQPGNRWRGDAAWSFRTGAGATWTAYATDVWRDHGDVNLDARQDDVSSGTLRTGRQNLFIAGVTGSVRVRPGLNVSPVGEVRVLDRAEAGGDGWLAGIGASVPLVVRGFSMIPSARFNYGGLADEVGESAAFWGGELGVSIGWGPGN